MKDMAKKENIKFRNILIIFLIISLPILTNEKQNFFIIKYHFSYIDLIVKGTGKAKLFFQDENIESCIGIDIPN